MNSRIYPFINHLRKRWFLYVVWLVVAIFVCGWAFTLITRPKANEKTVIFIACYGGNMDGLKNELNGNRPQNIKQVEVYYHSPDALYFNTMYNFYGIEQGDILILPKSKIYDVDCVALYQPLDLSLVQKHFGQVETYDFEGSTYGIKIFDGLTLSGGSDGYVDYCNGTEAENFYLFFNKNSLHTGEFSDSSSQSAVELAKLLMTL